MRYVAVLALGFFVSCDLTRDLGVRSTHDASFDTASGATPPDASSDAGIEPRPDASIAPDGSASPVDASSIADGASPNPDATLTDGSTRPEFCNTLGPFWITTERGQECAGTIAERTFRYGICSCNGFDGTSLTSDARVGFNGDLSVSTGSDIGGTTTVAGQIIGGNSMIFGADVAVGGNLAAPNFDIAGDLRAGGSVRSITGGTVTGDLITTGTVTGVRAARFVSQAVHVPPPCACDDDELLNIGAAVANAQRQNHNSELGIDLDQFAVGDGSLLTLLNLECGIVYLSGVSVSSTLTIRVTGRSALFIGGDFLVTNNLQIIQEAGAELDIFVAGNFSIGHSLFVGDGQHPAATRFYVAGTQPIAFSNTFGSFKLYAPRAEVSARVLLSVRGALFAANLTANSLDLLDDQTPFDSQCEAPVAVE